MAGERRELTVAHGNGNKAAGKGEADGRCKQINITFVLGPAFKRAGLYEAGRSSGGTIVLPAASAVSAHIRQNSFQYLSP